MKNINRIIILLVGMIMVGCGSNGAANTNGNGVNIKQEEKEYDFRSSNWGDSIEDIKKSEKLKLEYEEDSLLVYSGEKIVNLDATVIYGFDKDKKLTDGFYNVNEKHTNDNLYIEDYQHIKESLSSKYGEPSYDDMEWNNDLYKDKQDDYGFAVSLGDLEYSSGWKVNTTYITLTLSGDNHDIELSLIYQDGTSGQEIDLSGL